MVAPLGYCQGTHLIQSGVDVFTLQATLGLDAVLTGAGMLVVLGLSVSLASELTKDQVTALTAGSVGAAGGLVIGYSVGRKRRSSWREAAEGSWMGSFRIPSRPGSVAREWGFFLLLPVDLVLRACERRL